jgi:6-pyruvoyltetrahydropterin/6-carboxytetrahydropterin synthase
MIYLTRRYPFSASHRLHTNRLSAEENARLFGKCNYPYGHGHNYCLEITVAGEPDPRTGLVMAPAALDALVSRSVLSRIDHANLNTDVPEFAATVPTTENLGIQIGRWLEENWESASARIARIRLQETGANTIEIEFHGQDQRSDRRPA